MRKVKYISLAIFLLSLTACSSSVEKSNQALSSESEAGTEGTELPVIQPGETAAEKSIYIDCNGDSAVIPAEFRISDREDEQTICSGLVVIGPDESEFVWIPTTQTSLAVRDFGSYFLGGSISGYYDETELESYQEMVESTELYGGFYIGRFEASYGSGYNLMGGACPGSSYPAALRDPLPGNDHHPNVTFRIGLYIK